MGLSRLMGGTLNVCNVQSYCLRTALEKKSCWTEIIPAWKAFTVQYLLVVFFYAKYWQTTVTYALVLNPSILPPLNPQHESKSKVPTSFCAMFLLLPVLP